jgi:gliding motility-associated-like protein
MFDMGETEVTYTATDEQGNSSACSFKITVMDQQAPVFSECPSNIELSVTDACEAVVQWNAPAVSDNCSMEGVIATHASGDIFPLGVTEVKYVATDIYGNESTCSFKVTVKLSTPPVITNCPGDIKAKTLESGVAVQWIEPTATSFCPDVTLTASHRPGDLFSLGKTEVVYTATDRSGNQAECVFNIEVAYEDIEFSIARIVTPDGDGTNDRWILSNIEKFQDNRVTIVDRWGSVVFEAAGYNNENTVWNGDNLGGTTVPTGTYFFTIIVRLGPSQVEKNGFIEVIR